MQMLKTWEHRLGVSNVRCEAPSGNKYREQLIWAVKRGSGKTIMIYPVSATDKKIPIAIAEEMQRVADCGAIVGCCSSTGELWDVVIENEQDYPRKLRTFLYSKTVELYRNDKGESHHGREEE